MLFAVKKLNFLVAAAVVGDAAAFGTRELDSVRAGVREKKKLLERSPILLLAAARARARSPPTTNALARALL